MVPIVNVSWLKWIRMFLLLYQCSLSFALSDSMPSSLVWPRLILPPIPLARQICSKVKQRRRMKINSFDTWDTQPTWSKQCMCTGWHQFERNRLNSVSCAYHFGTQNFSLCLTCLTVPELSHWTSGQLETESYKRMNSHVFLYVPMCIPTHVTDRNVMIWHKRILVLTTQIWYCGCWGPRPTDGCPGN